MKNYFYVFELKKIVVCLLIMCAVAGITSISYNKVIETVATNRLLPIYSVETPEKKVALTFDLAWRSCGHSRYTKYIRKK